MDNKKAAEILCKMPFWERFTDEEYTAMSRAVDVLNNDKKDIIYCRDCIYCRFSFFVGELVCDNMKLQDITHDSYCSFAVSKEMYEQEV